MSVVTCDSGECDVRGNIHVVPSTQSMADPNEWELLGATLILPEEAIRLEVDLLNWYGDGDVYFDDLSILEL